MDDIFGINSNERHYDDEYNEEELLENDGEYFEDEDDKEDYDEEKTDDESDETRVHLSFACEDCDYRWDDVIVGNKDKIEREEFDLACPMCGSLAITQI